MKYFKIILLSAVLAITSIAYSSCSESNGSSNTEKQGKEYTSAYICPMHCTDSGSDKTGTCPVCGMAYEQNKEHKGDGRIH